LEDGLLMIPGRRVDLPVRTGAFLQEAARAACAASVSRHASALGREAGRISLRDPRARWGSCTSAGDLMFSWRLVLAPMAVLDYVVAHEVAHLAELNHSPRFWARVRAICPDFSRQRTWLRQHGPGLHAWDFSRAAPD
jgi:predicted metal-dependent hydrolase